MGIKMNKGHIFMDSFTLPGIGAHLQFNICISNGLEWGSDTNDLTQEKRWCWEDSGDIEVPRLLSEP